MTSAARWPKEGLLVGLLAFATVAGFYAAFDLLAARGALYTVSMLGVALTEGLDALPPPGGPAPVAPAAVLAYSAAHLVASLAVGLLVCRVVHEAELRPMHAQLALLVIVAGFAGTIALIGAWSAPVRDVLPWWSIIAANGLAVLVAGQVMLRRHPDFLPDVGTNPRFPAA